MNQSAASAPLLVSHVPGSMLKRQRPVSLVVAPVRRDVTDRELGLALVSGDAWAIRETWDRFAPGVIALGRRALGSEAEGEDIAQETFQRLFGKAQTLREPERLRSFVFSFAIRVLKSELRRKKTRAWLSFHKPETLVDAGGDFMDVESRDVLRRFYLLLDRLAPRHRLVFALRHLESMTVDEVAAHMELSISTVKRALERATEKLVLWIELDPGLAEFVGEQGWVR
jgi:RNA polymerase sigma-70 factor (ECF subfamily)